MLAVAALAVLALAAPATANTFRTDTPGSQITPYYDSGQWSKDISAVVKKAKSNLKKDLAAKKAPKKPAVVLDIDETSVYNAPCLEPLDWALAGLATCAVQAQGAVTPVLGLYKYAVSKKVAVYFITGRPEAIKPQTDQLLHQLGYTKYTLILRPATDTQDSVIPYKSGARADIEKSGATILANAGDQDSDLAGGHAKRRYKLPNPVYVIT
jgi:predicted secreted acid phosphatase